MIRLLSFCLACLLLTDCASAQTSGGLNASIGAHLADLPHWMGGLPADAPPRRGTPAYDAWMAQRAKEAARPKNLDAKDVKKGVGKGAQDAAR